MRPLIHIGFHKTGSTWLQKHLFRKAASGFGWIDADPQFFLAHPLRFDADAALETYKTLLQAVPEGGVPVISNERLSGHPHSGGYDSAAIATRIHKVFPDAKILIVIREQKSAILSSYKQYVKKGGMHSLQGYLSPKKDAHVPQFNPDHFAYDALIDYYFSLFGRENVCVLSYAEFASAPASFLGKLYSFADVTPDIELPVDKKTNKQAPAITVWLKARLNLFIRRDTVNGSIPTASPLGAAIFLPIVTLLGRITPSMINKSLQHRWRKRIDEEFSDYFDESNRRTKEMTGIDLRADEAQ